METIDVLVKPNIDKAEDFIKKAIEKREVLFIVGNCCVEYKGRTSSKLGPAKE